MNIEDRSQLHSPVEAAGDLRTLARFTDWGNCNSWFELGVQHTQWNFHWSLMTNLDSIFKSRDITLPTKVRLVKAMVFPVVMYGCESWTVKKAECQRIDAFELWCWRRLLRIPWTARRSNQSILKESALGFLWKEWPPHVKSWLIGKDSDAGRDWGQEEKGTTEDEMAGWHHWLNGRESEWTPGVGDRQGGLACCDSWGRKESDTTERPNWTDSHSSPWCSYSATFSFHSCSYRGAI